MGKLENMLGCSGNRTSNLWTVNPMLCQVPTEYVVRSVQAVVMYILYVSHGSIRLRSYIETPEHNANHEA